MQRRSLHPVQNTARSDSALSNNDPAESLSTLLDLPGRTLDPKMPIKPIEGVSLPSPLVRLKEQTPHISTSAKL